MQLKNVYGSSARLILLIAAASMMLTVPSGCGTSAVSRPSEAHEEGTGDDHDEDHHDEHEHENPPHWPEGITDAAEKIRTRIGEIRNDSSEGSTTLRDEVVDLVSWAPEIAADTDLTEADWVPIYELSEQCLREIRRDAQRDIPVEKVNELAELLDQAALLLADADSETSEF